MDSSKLNYLKGLTTIFVTDPYDKSGGSFLHYLKLNHIMPERVLIVSSVIENYPYISEGKCYELEKLNKNIHRLTLRYGFMQVINVPRALTCGDKMKVFPFPLNLEKASFLVEMINISTSRKKRSKLFYWQKQLFSFLLRNSALDIEFYRLPYNKTMAIGTYYEI